MNEDIEDLKYNLQKTKTDLANTKLVLGTLVVWLQSELGVQNATKLIDDLNK